jgi:dipeptidyl aminopeptidase/acylaminoacyl peptidase
VVVVRGVTPTEPPVIAEVDATSGAVSVLHRSIAVAPDPADLAVGRLVEFPTTRERTAFGIFYPPHNARFDGPTGERPPLIVTSHGGPTSAALVGYSMLPQFFASRGFAVLDVDYGGSTGYGREYRRRLEGEWGIVDVDDCVAGARWLAAEGLIDGERVAIRGSSASGYTTLCALTFTDAFDAGVSRFGIGDLETFIAQTHKFESRYLDRLIGPYATQRRRYHDRSPLNFTERISCPVLIVQGLEDRVVPPAQAEQIVTALRERGVPHAYVAFPGEDHGFRSREAITRAFEAELSFYGQVFGFTPADRIEPLDVVFLNAGATLGADRTREP